MIQVRKIFRKENSTIGKWYVGIHDLCGIEYIDRNYIKIFYLECVPLNARNARRIRHFILVVNQILNNDKRCLRALQALSGTQH